MLTGPQRDPRAAVLEHRGRPALTRASGRVHVHARPAGRGRRPADHDRLAAGARPDRDGAAEPGRRRPGRGPDLSGGAAGVPARRLTRRSPMPCDEHGPDPGRADRGRARDRREGRLPHPDLPEPDRAHDAAPSAAPRIAEAAAEAGLWLVEDDPYSALRLEGEAVDLLAAQPAAPTARSSSRRSPRCSRRACGSATCARRRRCAGRSPWPSRPPTCTPRPSPRWPRRAGWRRTTSATHIAGLAAHYRPRRDALLAGLRGVPARGLALHAARGRPVHLGRRCRDGYDAEASSPRAIERGVAFVPGLYFYAGEPRPRDAARLVRHRHAGRAARGRRPSRRRLRGVGDPTCPRDHTQTWTGCATRCASATRTYPSPKTTAERSRAEEDDGDA